MDRGSGLAAAVGTQRAENFPGVRHLNGERCCTIGFLPEIEMFYIFRFQSHSLLPNPYFLRTIIHRRRTAHLPKAVKMPTGSSVLNQTAGDGIYPKHVDPPDNAQW